ncbi:MAG: 2OG-Fe(II) oxygenase [Maricaulaceae bacterium]|nr:2OG-Fe(II) oxygenase [Maricaulaceae bacterium]
MASATDFERQYEAARVRSDWAEARRCLERGAGADDPFCCAQLGVWLLLGHMTDRDDGAGFRLVRIAARAGAPEARRLLATLYARGRGVEANWAKAVDWLVRGARAGDADAMRQLAFLLPEGLATEQQALLAAAAQAGDVAAQRKLSRMTQTGPVPERIDWARIRRAARRPVLADGADETVCEAPLVRLRHGFLSEDLCDYLICAAGPFLTRASVNDPEAGADRIDASRTNMFANFWLLEGDVVTDCVDRMLARLVGVTPETGEPLSVLRYRPGEQFAPHFDFFDPASPVHAGQIAQGGQRIITCLVYLNAGYEAGETAFLDAGFKIRGEPGAAVFWRNADEDGAPDRATRHAGLPPASGEKWLLSKWFRDRPQTDVRTPGPAY